MTTPIQTLAARLVELEAKVPKAPWSPELPPINGGEDNPVCQPMAELRNVLPALVDKAMADTPNNR